MSSNIFKSVTVSQYSNGLGIQVEMEDGEQVTVGDLLRAWQDRKTKEDVAITAYQAGFNAAFTAFRKFIAAGGNIRQLKNYKGYICKDKDMDFDFRYVYPKVEKSMPLPWKAIKLRILERDDYKCHYCGGKAITADHKNPMVSGGTDDEDNLVAVCVGCNFKKSTSSYDKYIDKIGAVRVNG